MSRKKDAKPYWEMTTAELRGATKEFDEDFIFDCTKPLTPEMKARWERAKIKGEPAPTAGDKQAIAVRLDKTLLKRCTALAKKKRLSRDALIERGLRVLLAAGGLDEDST